MESVQKPFTRQELEARVQEADAEVASIWEELEKVLDGGAEAVFDEMHEVKLKIHRCRSPMENQKLREEYARLSNDFHIIQYHETNVRLMYAQRRYDSAVEALENMGKILSAAEAPPPAPVTHVPSSETKKTPHPSTAESKFLLFIALISSLITLFFVALWRFVRI